MFGFLSRHLRSSLVDVVKEGRIRGRDLDRYVNEIKSQLRDVTRENEDISILRTSRGWQKIERDFLVPRLQAIDSAGKRLALEDPVRFLVNLFEEKWILALLASVHGPDKEHVEARTLLERIEAFEFDRQTKGPVTNARPESHA